MKVMVQAKCPYCGNRNNILVEQRFTSPQSEVICCDLSEGGCDKQFVLTTRLGLSTITRSIVGE